MSKPALGVVDLIRDVATLASEPSRGWKSYGPPGDQLQVGTVRLGPSEYTLLRGGGQVEVYTPAEWDDFQKGVRGGEFNKDAGLPSSTEEKGSSRR